MPRRYVILSDLHFGKHVEEHNVDALNDVWAGADHLIINGDACELHDPRYCARAVEQVLLLQRTCEEQGVGLTLLAGNHDPAISTHRHLFFYNQRVLVTHGDAVHPAIAPWCFTAPIARAAFNEAMASLPREQRDQLRQRLWASQHAAAVKWEKLRDQIGWMSLGAQMLRPWSFLQVLMYWAVFPLEAARFSLKFAPSARFLIVGHTHRQGTWTRRGVTIVNTGAYSFPARPRAVVMHGTSLSVHHVKRRNGRYYLQPDPITRWTMPCDP